MKKLNTYFKKRNDNQDNKLEDEPPQQTPGKAKGWKLPNAQQWKFLLRSLSIKEKRVVIFALFFAWILIAGWAMIVYIKDTNRTPALGGNYTEGMQGQPLYINPVVSHSNPVDSDLGLLIFSSLFRYDPDGKLKQDLVDKWDRSEDGLIYTIHLRKDAKWQDGKPLNAEDVLFTLNLIRNPSFGSTLRGNWEGIGIDKLDDYTLKFTLKKAYVPFLHNLTFGIIPKHLWENITSDKFLLTDLNRKPVGSGPYSFLKLEKNKDGQIISVTLKINHDYYGPKPHLQEISFNFYTSFEDELNAYKSGEIKGIAHLETDQAVEAEKDTGIKIYNLPTTRIYALFLNQQKSALAADKNIREALDSATDKDEILKEALNNKGVTLNTPLLPNMLGFDQSLNHHDLNIDKAKSILDDNGWKTLDDKEEKKLTSNDPELHGIRYNQSKKQFLTITLTTPNYPELLKTADLLKKQWQKIGVNLKLEIVDTSETLQNKIQERNYDILLFGEMLQADPDPTPFWNSASKQAPGLNLSMYDNSDVDGLLDQGRQEVSEETRAELYRNFQQIISQDRPAIFLFSPYYLYGVSEEYKGVGEKIIYNPSDRLNDVGNRYLFTTRSRY